MTNAPLPNRRLCLALTASLFAAGCASLNAPPIKASVVDIESLPGEGMEVRLMVKLRVQNPTDNAIDFDGASLDLDVRGMSFASGVSGERGSVPRFGELIVSVPVTISAAALLRQAFSLVNQGSSKRIKLDYVARGRLAGGMLGGQRFESSGEVDWPPEPAKPVAKTAPM